MQAQRPDMGYGGKLLRNSLQAGVRQQQGVTPAQDDFADFSVTGEVIERVFPCRSNRVRSAVREVAPEAVAAMNGTGTCQGKQCTPGILVQQARDRHGMQLIQGIPQVTWLQSCFCVQWQYLAQQGVMSIPGFHARDEAARDPQGELTGNR